MTEYTPKAVRGGIGCSPFFFDHFFMKIYGKVLDLGCGKNKFRELLENDKDVTYTGLDYDSSVEPQVVLTINKDAILPFEDKTFDTIIAIHFIDHLDWAGAVRCIAECRRVLKDTGVFLFEVGGRGDEEKGDNDGHWINFGEGMWKLVKLLENSFQDIYVTKVYNNRTIGKARKEAKPGLANSKVEAYPLYKEWVN